MTKIGQNTFKALILYGSRTQRPRVVLPLYPEGVAVPGSRTARPHADGTYRDQSRTRNRTAHCCVGYSPTRRGTPASAPTVAPTATHHKHRARACCTDVTPSASPCTPCPGMRRSGAMPPSTRILSALHIPMASHPVPCPGLSQALRRAARRTVVHTMCHFFHWSRKHGSPRKLSIRLLQYFSRLLFRKRQICFQIVCLLV